MLGLLNKFYNEGYKGELGYIVGGFSALLRTQPGVVSNAPLEIVSPSDEVHSASTLGSRQLPSSAFQQGEFLLVLDFHQEPRILYAASRPLDVLSICILCSSAIPNIFY